MKYDNFLLFPICFTHFENIEVDHKAILSELKKIPYIPYPITSSFFPNLSTNLNISKNQSSLLNDLKNGETLINEINKCVKEVLKNFYSFEVDFKIATHWATKSKPKYIGEYHSHPNFWFTGCYYPDGSIEDKFYISVKNPKTPLYLPKKIIANELNSDTFEFIITEGSLVIFPAYLEHKIGFNNTNKDRYSVAFNIFPKGYMGDIHNGFII